MITKIKGYTIVVIILSQMVFPLLFNFLKVRQLTDHNIEQKPIFCDLNLLRILSIIHLMESGGLFTLVGKGVMKEYT